MIPELETLFNRAAERPDLIRWFQDESLSREYRESVHLAEIQRAALLETLTGRDHDLLDRLLENLQAQGEMEHEMFFCQGLSAGLRLGVLAAWDGRYLGTG